VVSKFWIEFKGKAQADEKAQHIKLYVSILKKPAKHLTHWIDAESSNAGNTAIGR
jgi:hypothetical protein